MTRSYRLGVQIVLGTVLISAIVCWRRSAGRPRFRLRAGQDLGPAAFPLGDFRLVERSGRTVTQADLADRVWVAAFIFTRCPLSCPRISSVMKGLQTRLAKTNVLLVSISVDPEHDTPAVLTAYAERFGASAGSLVVSDGRTSRRSTTSSRIASSSAWSKRRRRTERRVSKPFPHSDRLALVDRGRIVGFFESSDQDALDELVARASRLALPTLGSRSCPPSTPA